MFGSIWTDARVVQLHQMYVVEHRSLAAIGAEFKITKNAVRRKLQRMNWIHHKSRPPPPPTPWTPELVAKLQQMVNAGVSSMRIAQDLGMRRSSITGKMHRLGLSFPDKRLKAVVVKQPRYPSKNALFGLDVVNLRPNQCRWPIDNKAGTRRTYCKKNAVGKRPYCEEHAKRMYRKKDEDD